MSELESSVSAAPSSTQGIAISITANARSGKPVGQERPELDARGGERQEERRGDDGAPEDEHAGLISSTATLIRRYGIPQMTHIAEKSSQPRRDIASEERAAAPPTLRGRPAPTGCSSRRVA